MIPRRSRCSLVKCGFGLINHVGLLLYYYYYGFELNARKTMRQARVRIIIITMRVVVHLHRFVACYHCHLYNAYTQYYVLRVSSLYPVWRPFALRNALKHVSIHPRCHLYAQYVRLVLWLWYCTVVVTAVNALIGKQHNKRFGRITL